MNPAPVSVVGKWLAAGGRRLHVRGVTYGAFRPDDRGREYEDGAAIDRDFALMAQAGINAVRIPHTVPSRLLLDLAEQHGLRVMANLEAEQQVGHLGDGRSAARIVQRLRRQVAGCRDHPALLGYTLGNEIPAQVVRYLGWRRVERYLERLYCAAKDADPEGLVGYANYPSTEYLELPFLDLACFNIYLEARDAFQKYLARLQNLAGDRPLIVTEVGLDSRRHGEQAQATAIEWMVGASVAAGCAGTFVFAWTDEWHRAGADVDDWTFGVTDRNRRPKAALAALQRAYDAAPFPQDVSWPRVSVIVCSHNGAGRIRECLERVEALDYPARETIVVDDGSRDETAAVAGEFGVLVIRTDHHGLSHARNAGLEASCGEIVAYLDDDSYPDSSWLKHLVSTLMESSHVGAGGPNIAPPGDGLVADCVANAPGGPTHVLLSDLEAEHIPGCNMAFRVDALRTIGGFDPQFRVAGDDVDVCWRLQQRGWTLGFSPAAVVWHHCRTSVRAYWHQQRQYGRAEALLEQKWPEKYTRAGHLTWAGRLYGSGLVSSLVQPALVYHGIWGSAAFQHRLPRQVHALRMLPTVPEWYLVLLFALALALLGALWRPLFFIAAPIVAIGATLSCLQAFISARPASYPSRARTSGARAARRGVTMCLHLLQPLARLVGRARAGLTPWRSRLKPGFRMPRRRTMKFWVEDGQLLDSWPRSLGEALREQAANVTRGGDYDCWDLEARSAVFGSIRIVTAVEDHGARRRLVRVRVWPRWSRGSLLLVAGSLILALGAGFDGQRIIALVFAGAAGLLALRLVYDGGSLMAAVLRAVTASVPTRT